LTGGVCSTTTSFRPTTVEMNNIPQEQNTERQLQRLGAQRQLYATAKSLLGWQVILGGPVPVVLAFLGLRFSQITPYAALWGILVVLGDVLWLHPWQKRLRTQAARIQELFDCDVLELPWDELKAGKRPEPELVKEQSEKYSSWAAAMPPLLDWYAPQVGTLPIHVARLACQRSNCWWDAKQRRRYAEVVIAGVLTVFLIVLFLAMSQGFTIETFVLKVVAPLSPVLLLGVRQFVEQMEAASRLDSLREYSESIWNEALNRKPEPTMTKKARGLQSEIFENRKRSPLVFDGLFKLMRSDFEAQMHHGVAEYVAEAKQKLGLL
jgi:hypothetical protein